MSIVQSAKEFPSKLTRNKLTPLDPIAFTNRTPEGPILSVDPSKKNQPILGFGGAITDSVAHVFDELLPHVQEEILEALYGPTGQKYNLGRLTIGSTDFSVNVYSYNDVVGDFSMTNFSIDHDKEKIIPMVLRAQEAAARAGNRLQFVATPWSPPGWMKRNGFMRNSFKPGLKEDQEYHKAYALYIQKYVTAVKAAGVTVWALTIQNEPHGIPGHVCTLIISL